MPTRSIKEGPSRRGARATRRREAAHTMIRHATSASTPGATTQIACQPAPVWVSLPTTGQLKVLSPDRGKESRPIPNGTRYRIAAATTSPTPASSASQAAPRRREAQARGERTSGSAAWSWSSSARAVDTPPLPHRRQQGGPHHHDQEGGRQQAQQPEIENALIP